MKALAAIALLLLSGCASTMKFGTAPSRTLHKHTQIAQFDHGRLSHFAICRAGLCPKRTTKTLAVAAVERTVTSPVPARPGAVPLQADVVVHFATNSAKLDDDAKRALNVLARSAERGATILVTGHADNRGRATVNNKLAQLRARAVRDYLARKLSTSTRIGVATGHPGNATSNDHHDGRAANRRVDVIVMRKQPGADVRAPAAARPR